MKRATKLWIALAVVLLAGQVFFTLVTKVWFRTYTASGRSMDPAVKPGDLVVVRRTKAISRGDIIAYSIDGSTNLHRAMALGGDTIELRDKRLLVNGIELSEPYAHYDDAMESVKKFAPLRVPAEHVFVMGDDRDNANDSRYRGPIPMRDVTGRAAYIFSVRDGFRRVPRPPASSK